MARRALLFGISHTRYNRATFPPLPGAGVDADRVARALIAKRFAASDVVVPSGDHLTAASAQQSMLRMVEATGPNDLSVIYFSGHGWQFRDQSGDEPDHLDECLVFSDEPIGDDWFRAYLWPAAIPRARFVVIAEACHSESALLGFHAEVVPVPEPAREDKPWWRLSLSSCRDKEVALAMANGDGGSGVVTEVMLGILTRKPELSYRQLWQDVSSTVRDQYAHRGAGTPVWTHCGPDDSLVDSSTFEEGP